MDDAVFSGASSAVHLGTTTICLGTTTDHITVDDIQPREAVDDGGTAVPLLSSQNPGLSTIHSPYYHPYNFLLKNNTAKDRQEP